MSVTEFVQYRRKREGRTNYKKRLAYLKSGQHRLVIRRTNKQVIMQIVDYHPDGDKILCGVTSSDLKKHGWNYSFNSLPACYLAGILMARTAKEHKVTSAIVDLGLQSNTGSRLYAAIKGAIDGGLEVPADEEALPSKERLHGEHIAAHFKDSNNSVFTNYKKQKHDATKLPSDVEAVKKKIMQK